MIRTPMSESAIYTLGPEGTFSDRAARQLRAQTGATSGIHYCATLEGTVRAAAEHTESMAIVPIENSVAGTVAVVQDSILRWDVRIVGEMSVAVRFDCVSSAPLARVTRVFVHPVAAAQCLEFLAQLPQAQIVEARSNADALACLETSGTQAGAAAAIVPSPVEHRDLLLVTRNVQSGDENLTRFVLLKSAATAPELDYALPKTSIVVEPRANRPGLLRAILEPFERLEINVCRLESRPSAGPWSYRFFLDVCSGGGGIAAALEELKRAGVGLRVLGTYAHIST